MSKPLTMLERLKAEKARLEASGGGNFENQAWFKPEMGDNTIRIVPPIDDTKDPFVTVQLHYINVKKKDGTIAKGIPVRCYHELGEDSCPVCNYASKLLKSKNEEDIEAGKRYKAKEVYLYNVIDFAKKTILPYSAGKQVHEAIIGYMCDFADDDILNLDTGKNWKLIKKAKKGKPSAFNVEYVVRLDIKSSAVPAKIIQLLEETEVDLETLYQTKEETIINAFLGYETSEGSSSEEYEEEQEEQESRPVSRRGAKTPAPTPAPTPARRTAAKVVEEEPEEEEQEETPPPSRRRSAPTPAPAPAKRAAPAPAAKAPVKAAAKPAPKAAVVEDEDLDLDDLSGYDVDAELESMGV